MQPDSVEPLSQVLTPCVSDSSLAAAASDAELISAADVPVSSTPVPVVPAASTSVCDVPVPGVPVPSAAVSPPASLVPSSSSELFRLLLFLQILTPLKLFLPMFVCLPMMTMFLLFPPFSHAFPPLLLHCDPLKRPRKNAQHLSSQVVALRLASQ